MRPPRDSEHKKCVKSVYVLLGPRPTPNRGGSDGVKPQLSHESHPNVAVVTDTAASRR